MKNINCRTVVTGSEEETMQVAASLSDHLVQGDVLGLVGELGSGKTCFTRGIAKGIDVKDPLIVTSPTFVLMQSYEGRLRIDHYDIYRLEGPELASLGFYENRAESISIIEWADRVQNNLIGDYLRVEMLITSPRTREIRFIPVGKLNQNLENFVLNI